MTLSRRSLSSGQQIPPTDCFQIEHEPASRIPLTGICRSWLHQLREVPCRLLDSHFGRRKLEPPSEEIPGSKNVPCLTTESAEFECVTDRQIARLGRQCFLAVRQLQQQKSNWYSLRSAFFYSIIPLPGAQTLNCTKLIHIQVIFRIYSDNVLYMMSIIFSTQKIQNSV